MKYQTVRLKVFKRENYIYIYMYISVCMCECYMCVGGMCLLR